MLEIWLNCCAPKTSHGVRGKHLTDPYFLYLPWLFPSFLTFLTYLHILLFTLSTVKCPFFLSMVHFSVCLFHPLILSQFLFFSLFFHFSGRYYQMLAVTVEKQQAHSSTYSLIFLNTFQLTRQLSFNNLLCLFIKALLD